MLFVVGSSSSSSSNYHYYYKKIIFCTLYCTSYKIFYCLFLIVVQKSRKGRFCLMSSVINPQKVYVLVHVWI